MSAVTIDVGPHLTVIALAAMAYASLRIAYTWSTDRRRDPAEHQSVPPKALGRPQPQSICEALDPVLVVCEIVAASYRTSIEEILSASQAQPATRARQVAMRLIRELTGASYPKIGARFGRDHSTVIHALARTEGMLLEDLRERARAALAPKAPVHGAELPPPQSAGRRLNSRHWHRTSTRR